MTCSNVRRFVRSCLQIRLPVNINLQNSSSDLRESIIPHELTMWGLGCGSVTETLTFWRNLRVHLNVSNKIPWIPF